MLMIAQVNLNIIIEIIYFYYGIKLKNLLGLSNTTRTQVALGKGEFDQYDIGSETSITFCMKEFKSILTFAEIANIPITIYFEGAGR